jgi:carbon-monoxide dehydrogenase medium subunit
MGAEELMVGRTLDAALIAEVGEAVAREVSPISDVRATAEYRRNMCAVLTRRALEECASPLECTL